MKKSTVIILPIVLLVAIVSLLIFVFSGDLSVEYPIEGTWKVLNIHSDNGVRRFESRYYVFNEDDTYVTYENSEVKASGKYSLKFDTLTFEGDETQYLLKSLTENIVCFKIEDVAKGDSYVTIMKVENMETPIIDTSLLKGEWMVTLHANNNEINEKMVFLDSTFEFYRNNMQTPVKTGDYVWEGDLLKVNSLGMEMESQLLTPNFYVAIEKANGLVWEFKKVVNN